MSDKFHIGIEFNQRRYDIFVLGFDKGGGYFLTDLSTRKGKYFITRLRIKLQGFGYQNIPVDPKSEWITEQKPKMIHHFDGSAQVSGQGIKSGFFKTLKRPKGVTTKGPYFNDGGPIFAFLAWGIQEFAESKPRNTVMFTQDLVYNDRHRHEQLNDKHSDAFVFEGFYIQNAARSLVNPKTNVLLFRHPNFGTIPLLCLPMPTNHAGFIAIGCRSTVRGFKSSHGFTYGCGANLPDPKGYMRQIHILFPYDENRPESGSAKIPPTLSVKASDKILYRLDDIIYKARTYITAWVRGASRD